MKRSVITLLLISGLCTLCSCLSRQYHFVNTLKSWTDAQHYCREHYTDLATMDNQEDMEALMGAANGYAGDMWIGLYDDINSWQWSLEDRGFYGDGETQFRKWNLSELHNNSWETCVFMVSGSGWYSCPCGPTTPFICYNGMSHSHILVELCKTWEVAQRYCRENHTDLTCLRNLAENQKIQDIILKNVTDWVWICLFRHSWKSWSDQSSSLFRKWNQSEMPWYNRHCGIVRLGKMGAAQCDALKTFICYSKRKIYVLGVHLRTSSSVNMSDPAVGEAILEQMTEQLAAEGISGVKMQWLKHKDGKIFRLEQKAERKEQKCGNTEN